MPTPQTGARPEQLASDLLAAMNERDWGALAGNTSDDVQLLFPPGRVVAGRDGLERFLHELDSLVPDLTVIGTHILAGPDFAVVEYEASGHGTNASADGLGVVVMLFREGRLARAHLYVDTARWAELHRGESA